MNQLAKFGIVKKSLTERSGGQQATRLGFAKSAEGSDNSVSVDDAEALLSKTMGDNDNDDGGALTKSGMQDLLDKNLPDGDIPTTEDVKHIAKEQAEQVVKENATNTADDKEGTADRPDGEGSDNTEQDPDYEGDADKNPAEESDKVEEKSTGGHPAGCRCQSCQTTKSVDPEKVKAYLKSKLPGDQYKAVEPLLDEEDGEEPMMDDEDEPMMDDDPEPEPDPAEEVIEPEEELAAEEKAKSIGFDPANLSAEQKKALAKADDETLDVVGGAGMVKSDADGSALDADDDDIRKSIEKADGNTMSGSRFFDDDGTPKL
jgi:hypothetical protein